jgi:hypothetical protein
VADQATVIGKVILRQGASVWPQAVLRGDNELIDIGEGSNVHRGPQRQRRALCGTGAVAQGHAEAD